jgi:hypothetical protein
MSSHSSNPGQDVVLPRWRVRPWREMAILCLLVMDLCWLAPWFRTLTPATHAASPRIVALVFAVVLFLVHWIVRLSNLLNLRLDLRRVLLVILIVLNIWLAIRFLLYAQTGAGFKETLQRPLVELNRGTELIPDEFLVGLFVLILAWRALSHAQEYIEPTTVRRNFLAGLFLFIAYIFFNTIVTGENPGMFLYLFFLASFLAMGTARISVISSLRGGVRIPFDRNWFLGVLIGTTGIVAVASLIAWIFSTRLQILEQIGNLVLGITGLIMVALISPIIYLAQTILHGSRPDSAFLRNALQAMDDLRAAFTGLASNLLYLMDRMGVFDLAPRLKPILLWSVLLFIAFLVITGLVRWAMREVEEKGEERESLSSAEVLRLLQEALQSRLRKLAENLAGITSFRAGLHLLAAARIRRIYAQLMQLANRLGKPRPAALTPLEFLPALGELFPGLERELAAITSAYLRVRYGELPETQDELDEVEAAWERVKAEGQRKISQMEKSPKPVSLIKR